MTKRTNLTPAQGMKVPSGVHAMRRGGARREVTERVNLKGEDGKAYEGWALNVSRGGLRAILEEKVVLGTQKSAPPPPPTGSKVEILAPDDDDDKADKSE